MSKSRNFHLFYFILPPYRLTAYVLRCRAAGGRAAASGPHCGLFFPSARVSDETTSMAPGACLLLPRVNFIARHLAPLHRAFRHRSSLGSSPTLTPSFFRGLQAAAAAVSSGMYAPPMCLLFVRGCLLASLSLSLSLRV